MHPVVEPGRIDHEFRTADDGGVPPIKVRIEQSHLDVRMCAECMDRRLALRRRRVVEQDAHANATVGRAEQRIGEQPAGIVFLDDVVLQVDRALRAFDHLHPHREAVEPYRQQPKRRLARMLARGGGEQLSKFGRFRVGQR